MTLLRFCLATCCLLAGFSLCAQAGAGMEWKRYSDPDQRFVIQHPGTTKAEASADTSPGLLSRVGFNFEQPFKNGDDAGSLKFSFQVAVWKNTNHLTAEAWVKQHENPQSVLDSHSIHLAERTGIAVRTTNLAWTCLKIFVTDADYIYELRYPDIAAHKLLLPDDIRSYWAATFTQMRESFRFATEADRSR